MFITEKLTHLSLFKLFNRILDPTYTKMNTALNRCRNNENLKQLDHILCNELSKQKSKGRDFIRTNHEANHLYDVTEKG